MGSSEIQDQVLRAIEVAEEVFRRHEIPKQQYALTSPAFNQIAIQVSWRMSGSPECRTRIGVATTKTGAGTVEI